MSVTLYSMPGCFYCDQAKAVLTDNDISYEEVIVNESISVDEFMSRFPGISSVPVAEVNGKTVVGYDGLMQELSDG